MDKKTQVTKLENIRVYQLSMDIGEEVWAIVENWEYFHKKTIGDQWIRAIDSLTESKTWLKKAYQRKLVDKEIYEKQYKKLGELHFMLNAYIKAIGKKAST